MADWDVKYNEPYKPVYGPGGDAYQVPQAPQTPQAPQAGEWDVVETRQESQAPQQPQAQAPQAQAPGEWDVARHEKEYTLKGALETGKTQEKLGRLSFRKMQGRLSPQDEQTYLQLKAKLQQPVEEPGFYESFAGAALEMAPIMANALIEGQKMGAVGAMVGGTAGAIGGAVGGPLSGVTAAGGAGAGYKVGVSYGAAEYIYRIEAGLAYDEYVDKGIDPKIAGYAASAVGTVNALLELGQIGTILRAIPGGKRVVGKITGEILKKGLTRPTVKKALGTAAKNFSGYMVKETGQEVAQETSNIVGDIIATSIHNNTDAEYVKQLGGKEIFDRLVDTAVQSAKAFLVLGAVTGGPGAVYQAGKDVKRIKTEQKVYDILHGETEGQEKPGTRNWARDLVNKVQQDVPPTTESPEPPGPVGPGPEPFLSVEAEPQPAEFTPTAPAAYGPGAIQPGEPKNTGPATPDGPMEPGAPAAFGPAAQEPTPITQRPMEPGAPGVYGPGQMPAPQPEPDVRGGFGPQAQTELTTRETVRKIEEEGKPLYSGGAFIEAEKTKISTTQKTKKSTETFDDYVQTLSDDEKVYIKDLIKDTEMKDVERIGLAKQEIISRKTKAKLQYQKDLKVAEKETGVPTKAQIESGNYKKGRIKVHGFEGVVETPKGVERVPGIKVKHPVGYIRGVEGADGDQLDVIFGPEGETTPIFVVDQYIDGKFDEHKVMMGFRNSGQARTAHKTTYGKTAQAERVVEMTPREFKAWTKKQDMSKPAAETPPISEKQWLQDPGVRPYGYSTKKYLPGAKGMQAAAINRTVLAEYRQWLKNMGYSRPKPTQKDEVSISPKKKDTRPLPVRALAKRVMEAQEEIRKDEALRPESEKTTGELMEAKDEDFQEHTDLNKDQQEAMWLAKIFGVDLSFYKGPRMGGSGVFVEGPNTIAIHADTDKPGVFVLMHEIVHNMKEEDPRTWKDLSRYLWGVKNDMEFEIFSKALNDTRPANSQLPRNPFLKRNRDEDGNPVHTTWDEYMAEGIAHQVFKKEFWDGLQKRNPSLFSRFVAYLTKILNKIRSKIETTGTQDLAYFQGFESGTMDVIQDALVAFSKRKIRAKQVQAYESIVASAIRHKGKIYTGVSHADAFQKLEDEVGEKINWTQIEDDGFLTNRGRYIDRDEAKLVAAWADQLQMEQTEAEKNGYNWLVSEDIIRRRKNADLKQQIDVWHVSPIKFKKFSTDFMSTGTGGQMYGWGIYFADSESVRRYYERILGNRPDAFGIDDNAEKKLDKTIWDQPGEQSVRGIIRESMETFPLSQKVSDERFKQKVLDDLRDNRDMFEGVANEGILNDLNTQHLILYETAIELIEENKVLLKNRKPIVYKAKLHEGKKPEQYQYIDWEEPVYKKVLNQINKQLKKEVLSTLNPGPRGYESGGELYRQLETKFQSSKEASLLLLRAGIDGIKQRAGIGTGYVATARLKQSEQETLNAMSKKFNDLMKTFSYNAEYDRASVQNMPVSKRQAKRIWGHLNSNSQVVKYKARMEKRVKEGKGNVLNELSSRMYMLSQGRHGYFTTWEDVYSMLVEGTGSYSSAHSLIKSTGAMQYTPDDMKDWAKSYGYQPGGAKTLVGAIETGSRPAGNFSKIDTRDLVETPRTAYNYIVFDPANEAKIDKRIIFEEDKSLIFQKDMKITKISSAPGVDTKLFKNWFKGSKVVDENGKPLVMYHGTKSVIFDQFNTGQKRKIKFGPTIEVEQTEETYFTQFPEMASGYSGREERSRIIPAYINIKNPFKLYTDKGVANDLTDEQLMSNGYDGIILYNDFRQIIFAKVFRPDQIKSAITLPKTKKDFDSLKFQIDFISNIPAQAKIRGKGQSKRRENGQIGSPLGNKLKWLIPEMISDMVDFEAKKAPHLQVRDYFKVHKEWRGFKITPAVANTFMNQVKNYLTEPGAKLEMDQFVGVFGDEPTIVKFNSKEEYDEVKAFRDDIADGAVEYGSSYYNDMIKKYGDKLQLHTVKHTVRFPFSKTQLYGPVDKVDEKKTIKKEHPIQGEFEVDIHTDPQTGMEVIDGPLLSTDRAVRIEELIDIINKNKFAWPWYDEWNEFVERFENIPHEKLIKFIKLQAILSAQKGPQGNELEFAKLVDMLENGEDLIGGTLDEGGSGLKGDDIPKIMRVWQGLDTETTIEEFVHAYGQKVGLYMYAGLHPKQRDIVVIDRHMPKPWGYNIMWSPRGFDEERMQFAPEVIAEVAGDILEAARRLDISGGAAQAAVWYSIRKADVEASSYFEAAQIKPSEYLPQVMYVETMPTLEGPAVHYKKTMITEGDFVYAATADGKIQYNQYSESDIGARINASTVRNPFAELVYAYEGSKEYSPEPHVAFGRQPHLLNLSNSKVYDGIKDPVMFWKSAERRVDKDPDITAPGAKRHATVNAFADLIQKAGYDGFLYKQNKNRVVALFKKSAVYQAPESITLGLSDIVEKYETIPQTVSELEKILPVRSRNIDRGLKTLAKWFKPFNVEQADPTIARFGEYTSESLEIGAMVRGVGPSDAAMAFGAAWGVSKAQNFVLGLRGVRDGEKQTGQIFSIPVKKEFEKPSDINDVIEKHGVSNFNIGVRQYTGGLFIETYFADSGDYAPSPADIKKFAKFLNDIGQPGVKVQGTPAVAIELNSDNYLEHLQKYFGDKEGKKIYGELKEKGEKYIEEKRIKSTGEGTQEPGEGDIPPTPGPGPKPGDLIQQKDIIVKNADVVVEKPGAVVEKIGPSANKSLLDKVKTALEDFKENFVTRNMDRLHPIKQWLGEGKAYMLARGIPGVRSTIQAFLEHGKLMFDDSGAIITDEVNQGFLAWYDKLGEDAEKFFYWVVAKRAQALKKDNREFLFEDDDINAILSWVGEKPTDSKYTSWADINKEFKEFNNNILDIAQRSGLIDKGFRDYMASQGYYVPFYRVLTDPDSRVLFTQNKLRPKEIGARIKKLRGSELPIGDPVENMLRNWSHLINESVHNVARRTAFNEAKRRNLVAYQDDDGKDVPLVEQVNWADTVLFKKVGKEKGAPTFVSKKDGYPVLQFRAAGKSIFFKVNDPELFNALGQMDVQAFDNIWAKAFGLAKRGLTFGATFGPAFRIKNFLRDTLHTFQISDGFVPLWDSIAGMWKVWTNDPDYIKFMASGMAFGGSYIREGDAQGLHKYVNSVVKKEGKSVFKRIITSPMDALNWWQHFGEGFENAARVQLYSKLKRKGVSHLEAAFKARDLMDFNMSGNGTAARVLISTVPFMNARIQGLYKMGRSAVDRPGAFFSKSAIIAMASLALWWFNKDDDRYKELEDFEKFSWYHFWIGDQHFRIPKPFETGVLFSTSVEMAGDVITGNEEMSHVFDYLSHAFLETFAMNPTPQAVRPIIEQFANKSFFTGRPIEPMGKQYLEPGERYDPWNSETLRYAGKAFNISPKRLEALIRGYLSTFGSFMLGISDIFVREVADIERPTKRIDDYPFIGAFVRQAKDPRNTKYMGSFFDALKDARRVTAQVNAYNRTGDFKKSQDYANKNMDVIKMTPRLNMIYTQLKNISAEMKQTWTNDRMTPDQKKAHIDKLTNRRNRLVKQVYDEVLRRK